MFHKTLRLCICLSTLTQSLHPLSSNVHIVPILGFLKTCSLCQKAFLSILHLTSAYSLLVSVYHVQEQTSVTILHCQSTSAFSIIVNLWYSHYST
jgi:hypothetical protein